MSSRYAGASLEDRVAARRAALIDAGIELLGTHGAAAVKVRAACRAASLSERYFYESFPNGRDALLRAVHDTVAAQARAAIAAAIADPTRIRVTPYMPEGARSDPDPAAAAVAHAAVAAFTAFLEDDPRRGRVLLSESFADTVLAQHDMELVPAFAQLLVAQITALPDAPDATDAHLTAIALLGALRSLYLAWLAGDGAGITTERLNTHAARLVVAAARVSSAR